MWENVYCLHDIKGEVLLKPLMTSRNDVAVIREFTELVNNPDLMFSKHPGDFALVQIGRINLETLELIGIEAPRLVHTGLDLVKKEQ